MNSVIQATAVLRAARELRGTFRGDLVLPGDGPYEEARRVWNACIDRRPALIARCACTADVVGPPGPIRAKTTNDEVMPGGLPTRWHDSHAGYT
jgi:hypothetical protein